MGRHSRTEPYPEPQWSGAAPRHARTFGMAQWRQLADDATRAWWTRRVYPLGALPEPGEPHRHHQPEQHQHHVR